MIDSVYNSSRNHTDGDDVSSLLADNVRALENKQFGLASIPAEEARKKS